MLHTFWTHKIIVKNLRQLKKFFDMIAHKNTNSRNKRPRIMENFSYSMASYISFLNQQNTTKFPMQYLNANEKQRLWNQIKNPIFFFEQEDYIQMVEGEHSFD